MSATFTSTFEHKLIYIFRINDDVHKGFLKIGDATICTHDIHLKNSCHELNQAAKARINQYTNTAGISYELLHTEIAVYEKDGKVKAFRDYQVHDVLKRSGIKRHYFSTDGKQNEWFQTDLETAVNAIKAVKEGRKSLSQTEISSDRNPIVFRPEQQEAIKDTIAQFKKGKKMLWNAKMRFGKTLAALQVAKEMKFKKTIIFTHRPVVSDGWFDDFSKIFYDTNNYIFGSKQSDKGVSIEDLENSGNNYVYFASIQDLRGSVQVGGNFVKNELVFDIDWDYVITDEAHEGTQTDLGKNVINAIVKPNSKVLELSGTPFNLLSDYEEKEIYTWDYVMEQRAKRDWYLNRFGDSNPYEELPELNIYTYHLNRIFNGYEDLEDKAFNFREFFRTWTGDIKIDRKHLPEGVRVGEFVHQHDVWSFLNLITKLEANSNYPFSTTEYRDFFRHSLWMVPGVKEAKALSALMKTHPVFGSGAFEIVNVAGDGDEEVNTKDALDAVRKAIGKKPEDNYTITLSCGRLTTGVSVPEWTAVFMLSGTYSTSAANYLQTIFRVQTPANIGGKIKEKCYVFDFAPDRTLKMVAEASKVSAQAGKTTSSDRQIMGEFLNFCPVIAIDGTKMRLYDVDGMLQQLKRAYTDKVVRNGFDDTHIYSDNLLQLDGLELEEFKKLKDIIGASKQTQKSGEIDINKQGFTAEEYDQYGKLNKKPKRELTVEEKLQLDAYKNKLKQKQTAISILRGISIRIPLLVYGADIPFDEEITIENFTSLFKEDDLSWDEFMPRGVTKELFMKFSKYYDPDIFVAAGRQIRNIAKSADSLPPTERVKKIATLFATFKNPDKETVLTPWRVVNMHMSDCLGGYNFFNENHTDMQDEPRWVEHDEVTTNTLGNPDARILEINSKTGLYPLYVAYSIFRTKCKTYDPSELDVTLETRLWNETIAQNVFVICKTPMAKSITRRTLAGYTDAKVNTRYFEDLINQITHKSDNFMSKIRNGKDYWKANNNTNMKFNAIVGNPPYQVMDGGSAGGAMPVYHKFVMIGKKLNPEYLSMIMPSRWFAGGRGLDEFRNEMLNDKQIKQMTDFPKSRDCFNGVDIAGGVCYFLWENGYNGKCHVTTRVGEKVSSTNRNLNEFGIFIRDNIGLGIIHKIKANNFKSIEKLVEPVSPFGLRSFVRGESVNSTNSLTLISSAGKSFLNRDKIKKGINLIDKYKVVVGYLNPDRAGVNNASDGKSNVTTKVAIYEPGVVITETYIIVGSFNSLIEAQNFATYLKTKTVRLLIFLTLSSMHLTRLNFQFVPLQDFTKPWTDAELYEKYGLTEEEIGFIEGMIKGME